ncbi:GMC family oxidoreductase [Jiella mangrovi]|uniref:GMC family oxidoreductase N-terminal domain-containing protein n=1 Tax=Jiella mangrovi TaxID=2821407 RepID=A0ABS4BGC4_9HYPH|nr:GMC family oxidoreductase N-terminal domain-containing protein [Jiella mangrovi]MBP0615804.1 GMC family oxidoreductase N-terminal domain-containing protein [Jiella mangrovi]
MNWDYIVIGSGSAGSVLANRLSADPRNQVLLLEAGGSDSHIRYKLPALCVSCMGHPDADWAFQSEPDPSREGRKDVLSRGKVLGGSSSINGIVYVRGNRGDYDHWAQLGNRGWDYDTMLGYFRRIEGNRDGSSDTYGKSGPVVVGELRGVPPMTRVFVEAMAEIGVRKNRSYNGEPSDGVSIAHATHHKGLRWSAARGYLHPVRSRKNLTILTGANARRILFQGKRAAGVEFEHRGELRTEACDGEVILSASTFNSPKLLMLSGIGPAGDLQDLGIEVLHDSPGVGKNLHDHPASYVKALVNQRTTNQELGVFGRLRHGLTFLATRGGPATFVQSAVAFVKSRPELEYPDIQFHFGAYGYELTDAGFRMLDVPAVTLQPNVNRPRSRGTVKLRSSDPLDTPEIQMNLLGDPHDVETLVAGTRIARNALKTKAFAPYLVREFAPGPEVETDQDWERYTRRVAGHVYHACGTCRMGVDPAAVVDPELRVHGVEGLRVVDSSIIPQIPSANLNAISMAIGEKGSDMILAARR